MAVAADHANLLSRLQNEVNRVLEQTGRVFAAAASKNPKSDPTAHAIKLKHVLSDSSNRFHDALDQLEGELQIARLVFRRDLALLTAPSGGDAVPRQGSPVKHEVDVVKQDTTIQSQAHIKSDQDVDVPMTDLEAFTSTPQTGAAEAEVEATAGEQQAEAAAADEETSQPLPPSSSDTKTLSVATDDDKATQEVATLSDPAGNAASGPTGDANDNLPDTAASNAVDLESLFGSTSATAGPDGNDFNTNADDDHVFDFPFDADNPADSANDNIESFLPGLQDYANTQPDEVGAVDDTDLDALFSGFAVPPAEKNEQTEQDGDGARDTTFDDLLDFADLGTAQFAGSGQGGEAGAEFDFDFT